MLRRRRRRPPVLAELPAPSGEPRRPGALGGAELETFGRLLGALGGARAVLVTGGGRPGNAPAVAPDASQSDSGVDAQAALASGIATFVAGKLTLAIGLATAAAAEGRRAALLECDLARPSLAALLGLEPAPGLHEYLRLEAEAPQILQPLVLAGPGSAAAAAPLTCIVAGRPAPDAAALLASPHFAHAIAKLRSAYDLVVLDGPSLVDPSLPTVAAQSDAALACVVSPSSWKRLPIAVRGLVIGN